MKGVGQQVRSKEAGLRLYLCVWPFVYCCEFLLDCIDKPFDAGSVCRMLCLTPSAFEILV